MFRIDKSSKWHFYKIFSSILNCCFLLSLLRGPLYCVCSLKTTQTQHLSERPRTTCVPQEVPMQSCIWQHLRASFFHAGFNLICCQGIEKAEHSMELYSVGHRHRDGWMNVWTELWSFINTKCTSKDQLQVSGFYMRTMAGMVLYTCIVFKFQN